MSDNEDFYIPEEKTVSANSCVPVIWPLKYVDLYTLAGFNISVLINFTADTMSSLQVIYDSAIKIHYTYLILDRLWVQNLLARVLNLSIGDLAVGRLQ